VIEVVVTDLVTVWSFSKSYFPLEMKVGRAGKARLHMAVSWGDEQFDANIKDWYVFEFLTFGDSAAHMNIYYMQ
jgi:hypothetical protein